MHRDYGPYCNGTPVRLTLFSDRLECWNPGGVYGGQNIDDIGYANMPTRNPTLVSLLEIQKIAENRHSGIPVIREEAASRGLRQPEFLDRNGSFLVRFFNENATLDDLTTADRAGAFTRQSASQSIRSTDVDHHGNVRNDPGAMRGMILRYCREPRSAKDIAEHFGYNMTYMRKTFIRPMVAQGALSMTMPSKPRSKYQRYLAASDAASDAR